MSLAVSDGPVQDALLVCVEFTDVEFKGAGSENRVFTFDPPKKINLLAYQGVDAAPLLVNEELEPGEYQWIRTCQRRTRRRWGLRRWPNGCRLHRCRLLHCVG